MGSFNGENKFEEFSFYFFVQIFAVNKKNFLNKYPEILFVNPSLFFPFCVENGLWCVLSSVGSERLPTAMYDNYRSHNESLKDLIYLYAHSTLLGFNHYEWK